MPNWLLDDRGDLYDELSPSLRLKLGGFSLGEDFSDYVVRNLGFVLLAPQTNGSVKIRLRPRVTAPLALAGLIYWLSDIRPARILLSYHEGSWRHELIGSFAQARQRIIGLTAKAQEHSTTEYLSKPLTLPDAADANPLSALLRFAATTQDASLSTMTDYCLTALDGRYMVSELHDDTQRVVLRAVGPGLEQQARFWLERFVGTRLEDSADISYGRWIATATRDVLRTGKPRLDAVDVSILWPSGDRRRYQFQRALVPLSLGAGRRGILSATLKDPTVDLRGGARIERG